MKSSDTVSRAVLDDTLPGGPWERAIVYETPSDKTSVGAASCRDFLRLPPVSSRLEAALGAPGSWCTQRGTSPLPGDALSRKPKVTASPRGGVESNRRRTCSPRDEERDSAGRSDEPSRDRRTRLLKFNSLLAMNWSASSMLSLLRTMFSAASKRVLSKDQTSALAAMLESISRARSMPS